MRKNRWQFHERRLWDFPQRLSRTNFLLVLNALCVLVPRRRKTSWTESQSCLVSLWCLIKTSQLSLVSLSLEAVRIHPPAQPAASLVMNKSNCFSSPFFFSFFCLVSYSNNNRSQLDQFALNWEIPYITNACAVLLLKDEPQWCTHTCYMTWLLNV